MIYENPIIFQKLVRNDCKGNLYYKNHYLKYYNIIFSLKIIEELFFQGPNFWHNYLKI